MGKTFKLEVVTLEKIIFQGEVESLVIPSYEGYLGIMAGHAPIVCMLLPGEITYRQGSSDIHLATSGGFAEMSSNKTMVLADAVEKFDEIDLERAKRARDRAKKRLGKVTKDTDVERAALALKRADNRIRLAGKFKGGSSN